MSFGQSSYTFSDGGKRTEYQLSATEVFSSSGTPSAGRQPVEWGGGHVYTIQSASGMKKLRADKSANRKSFAPVFYDKSELPSAEKLSAMTPSDRANRMHGARRSMTAKLLVHMEESRFAELAATNPSGREKSLLNGWMLVIYPDAYAALDAADWMNKQGNWEFTPVFARQMEKRQKALVRPVNDPLYANQWHLGTTGFNLNMQNAWDTVTGKGINMAIVDDGLEIAHEDLAPNAFPLASGFHQNFNDGMPNDPSPLKPDQSHGTSCAGLAGAAGFNNIGVIGVAPEVRLMGLRLIAGATADDASGNALAWQPDGMMTHVSSNSWGPPDDGAAAGRMSGLQAAGLEKGATKNRGGLGTIYAVAAGNGRGSGDDSSYDEFAGSKYAIAVAAVNRDGGQSSYSESGMNVAVSALGGEFAPPGVLWTTSTSGTDAFNLRMQNSPASMAPINYTDVFNGTSAAAPQVSGAVALLLQANPNLGYRDVKEILMKTAVRDGLTGTDDFAKNGGGFFFSHGFGAGLINVSGALNLATGWTNLGPLVTADATTTQDGDISDAGDPLNRDLDFSGSKIRVEHVELTVTATHANRGDLSFFIISPSGMKSTASSRKPDTAADFTSYTFTSVRNWGETSTGTWRIGAIDGVANGTAGRFVSAKLTIYGTAQ